MHSGSIRNPLTRLCESFRAGLDADSCEIFLAGTGGSEPALAARSDITGNPTASLTPAQWKALARIGSDSQAAESDRSLLFPLRHGKLMVAALRMGWRNRQSMPMERIGTVADQVPLLSRMMVSVQLAQQQRRHDLYEERASISRELHDSLAQSLTYLKIQASRLDKALPRRGNETATSDEAMEVLGELKSTLSDAYRQLRELMTTFRLTMHGKSFRHAVRDSVDEFTTRSNIAFELDNAWRDDVLSVEEEMQVLQIVREALYNIVRHSRADHARVSLTSRDNVYRLSIEDNGIGVNPDRRKLRHHGLVIMQERSRRLDGAMQISSPDPGGTLIDIHFTPRVLRS